MHFVDVESYSFVLKDITREFSSRQFCSIVFLNRLEPKGKINNCKWHLLLFRYDLHALFFVSVW